MEGAICISNHLQKVFNKIDARGVPTISILHLAAKTSKLDCNIYYGIMRKNLREEIKRIIKNRQWLMNKIQNKIIEFVICNKIQFIYISSINYSARL